jgi:hypothetical protein
VNWYAELQIVSRPLFPEGFDPRGRLVNFAAVSDESLFRLLRSFPRLMKVDQVLDRIMHWQDQARNAADPATPEKARKNLRFLDPVLPRPRGQRSRLHKCLSEDYDILRERLSQIRLAARSFKKECGSVEGRKRILQALRDEERLERPRRKADAGPLAGWNETILLQLLTDTPAAVAKWILAELYGVSEYTIMAAIKRGKKSGR